jgi:hypothetical protein
MLVFLRTSRLTHEEKATNKNSKPRLEPLHLGPAATGVIRVIKIRRKTRDSKPRLEPLHRPEARKARLNFVFLLLPLRLK